MARISTSGLVAEDTPRASLAAFTSWLNAPVTRSLTISASIGHPYRVQDKDRRRTQVYIALRYIVREEVSSAGIVRQSCNRHFETLPSRRYQDLTLR